MANGESLVNLPLRRRDEVLRSLVRPKDKYLELVRRTVIRGIEDVEQAIDLAIQRGEEGLMIKDLDEGYMSNERKWIKVKPDYIGGVGDNLDLVILGAFLGEGVGARSGTPSHFLLGVPAPVSEGGKLGDRWYTVAKVSCKTMSPCLCGSRLRCAKVGTGYNLQELSDLQYRLQKYWKVSER
jgi:DNA ligase-4